MALDTASDISFEFELIPIDKIHPWGAEDNLSLHWFGLTTGYFWIKVGNDELYRYSDAIIEQWRKLYPTASDHSQYAEYPVARSWEDILQLLPNVLEPVLSNLAELIVDGDAWDQWGQVARTWMEEGPEEAWDVFDLAVRWWDDRRLDSGHLRLSPQIWFWRVGDTIHVRWDNRRRQDDGISVWQAQFGEITVPVEHFIERVKEFDTRFIAAMAERVAEIRSGWSRPEIMIDLDELLRQQGYRSTCYPSTLKNSPVPGYDWPGVRNAIGRIDREIKQRRPCA